MSKYSDAIEIVQKINKASYFRTQSVKVITIKGVVYYSKLYKALKGIVIIKSYKLDLANQETTITLY